MISERCRRRGLALALAGSLLLAPPALAQGRGRGHGQGRGKAPQASSSPLPASGTGVRELGAWLDDASVAPPGTGWLSLSVAWWRSPLATELDAPVVDGAMGVTRRVQLGLSVPYYRLSDGGGPAATGIGDVYVSAKLGLRDPDAHADGIGFAVAPLVEMLSDGSVSGRWHWAIPVSVEVRRPRWRAYGTGGYFSRGAVFGGAAVEAPVSDRVWLTGSLTHTYALGDAPLDEALGLTRSRTDVNGGAAFALAPSVVVFGSVGRTLSSTDLTRTTLAIAAGVSFGFAADTPITKPR
jgi:hypothetical protein